MTYCGGVAAATEYLGLLRLQSTLSLRGDDGSGYVFAESIPHMERRARRPERQGRKRGRRPSAPRVLTAVIILVILLGVAGLFIYMSGLVGGGNGSARVPDSERPLVVAFTPSSTPRATPTAASTPTSTSKVAQAAIPTDTPVATPTMHPSPTPKPVPTAASTPTSTSKVAQASVPTAIPTNTSVATPTKLPAAMPTATPKPSSPATAKVAQGKHRYSPLQQIRQLQFRPCCPPTRRPRRPCQLPFLRLALPLCRLPHRRLPWLHSRTGHG